ncbi:MAG TPA: carbohydrate ABC transporter permease [Anaerovoracaceae bacterium]|nr:carbohydrate ABC transporter permease [Anaerovoracaceae bacterium]
MRISDIIARILQGAVMIFLAVFTLSIIYPLVWMAISGFKTKSELFTDTWAFPTEWSFANYIKAWEYGVANYLVNSIIVTSATVVLTIFVSALCAYVLSRFEFKYKNLVFLFILGGMMVSPEVVLISLYKLLQVMHLYDTYLALVLTYTAFHVSFTVFLMRSYILSIPKEIEESAVIDGCGMFMVFLRIILPISRPIIATSALLAAMAAWNEFMFALVFMKTNTMRTLPVGLVNLRGTFTTDWPVLLAALSISALIMIVVFLVFQKQLVRGLTQGGIKG